MPNDSISHSALHHLPPLHWDTLLSLVFCCFLYTFSLAILSLSWFLRVNLSVVHNLSLWVHLMIFILHYTSVVNIMIIIPLYHAITPSFFYPEYPACHFSFCDVMDKVLMQAGSRGDRNVRLSHRSSVHTVIASAWNMKYEIGRDMVDMCVCLCVCV